MSTQKLPSFISTTIINSTYDLESLAESLSQALFGGATFAGKEKRIYDEVPTVFIDMLGLRITLQQTSTHNDNLTQYILGILPNNNLNSYNNRINLGPYITSLLIEKLKSNDSIEVLFWEGPVDL